MKFHDVLLKKDAAMSNTDKGTPPPVVYIDFTNHKGLRAIRRVIPQEIWIGETQWHPAHLHGPQWFLRAWDEDKDAERDFPMAGVHGWYPVRKDGGRPVLRNVPGSVDVVVG